MTTMKTIVIGSGGREHAIAWALARSGDIKEVVCIPGNGGTAVEEKCSNVSANIHDIGSIVDACVRELSGSDEGSFVVVGPEDPLAAGLATRLAESGIRVVGASHKPAMLEASKDIAKAFMKKYGVACAESETHTDLTSAIAAVKRINGPVVIKADGLAAGKGVVVAPGPEEAIRALKSFMEEGSLGSAGRKVLVEEYLQGDEISILAAVSVTPETAAAGNAVIQPFVTARDHKRLRDGAKGPNTGGMGAIAPVPELDDRVLEQFRTDILEPTLQGLISEQFDYRGFIFFGLMLTKDGPKLLEYNVRLGDPETQAVLPLMDFDFARMCGAIIDGTLASFDFRWKDGYVCAPVAVSGGYPNAYPKGLPIFVNRAAVEAVGARVFFAGAINDKRSSSQASPAGPLVTSGGRVLAVSAHGTTLEEAREKAYRAMEAVSFDGMFYRRDIGLPGAAVSGDL